MTWKGRPLSCVGPKLKRPRWCSNDFIRSEHITEVQRRSETLQTSDSKGKSHEGKQDVDRELALNVCACVQSKITNALTRARERCRRTFYEHIGFLFYDWSLCGIDLRQSETEFIWNADTEPPFSLESIADATEMVIGKSIEKEVKESNMKVWNNLINKTSGFTLLVSYYVSVKPKVRKTKKADTKPKQNQTSDDDSSIRSDPLSEGTIEAETKRIYRAFNLLDIAENFYSSYCNSKSDAHYEIMYSSVHSFKVMFSFASVLRKWLSELIEKFEERGPVTFRDEFNHRTAKAGFYDLYPSHSRLHSTLMSNCLSLSREEFLDDCLSEKYLGRFKSYQESQKSSHGDIAVDESESNDSDAAQNPLFSGPLDHFDEEEDDDFTQRLNSPSIRLSIIATETYRFSHFLHHFPTYTMPSVLNKF